jgi:hypothetical protein
MQIKTTLRFHLTPVRVAIIKNTNITKAGEDMEKGTLIHFWWDFKLVQPLWKTIRRLLKKLNIDLPYNPTIPLLGIYLKECDSSCYKSICTPMFIARCPSTDKWIKKMWYLYTMNFT